MRLIVLLICVNVVSNSRVFTPRVGESESTKLVATWTSAEMLEGAKTAMPSRFATAG